VIAICNAYAYLSGLYGRVVEERGQTMTVEEPAVREHEPLGRVDIDTVVHTAKLRGGQRCVFQESDRSHAGEAAYLVAHVGLTRVTSPDCSARETFVGERRESVQPGDVLALAIRLRVLDEVLAERNEIDGDIARAGELALE
jgi:hypothetical protein